MAPDQNLRRSKRIPVKPALTPPTKRETYKWRGARYEHSPTRRRKDEDEDVGEGPPRKRARLSTTTTATEPLRRAQKPSSVVSRRRKRTVNDGDEVFRKHCRRQYEQLAKSGSNTQAANTAHVLPFLREMRLPGEDRIRRDLATSAPQAGEPPEAYILTTADAKSLLASNNQIQAPVFVPGGARALFNTENDTSRPVEQLLSNCFVDEKELNCVHSLGESRSETMSALRERFLGTNGPVDEPWNVPDISNPLADQATPDFLMELGSSNFFNEMMRRLLDVSEEDICQDSCKKRTLAGICCEDHRLTVPELTSLHDGWRCWRGTVMLAEAGAATPGHYDKWALPTWISCYEGEVGFCWQSHPSDEERVQWLEDPNVPKGEYRFKVLRAGDTVYMPPGTVHHVFRLPKGKQTFCMAAHPLRRQRLDEWLSILLLDLTRVIEKWDGEYYEEDYHCYVPGLVRIVRYLLGQAKTKRDVERYGGRQVLQKAKNLAERLHDLARRIERLAAEETDARAELEKKTTRAKVRSKVGEKSKYSKS